MASDHQLNINMSFHTLPEAYERLGIKDTSISDGDVVAAFQAAYEKVEGVGVAFLGPRWSIEALKVISQNRQSQLLAFILTIIPHLTRENVSLLATPPESTPAGSIPSEVIELESDDERTMTPGSNCDHSIAASSSDDFSLPSDQSSSTSIGTMSTSEDSNESDFDDYIGGKFWNGATWRCEECNDELVEGQCPIGHVIDPCRVCGQPYEAGCTALCDDCHKEFGDRCSECADGDSADHEGPLEDGGMVRDDSDNVWRCTDCLWEVEANGENEGQCHCVVESNDPSAECFAYPIDLSCYDDYEPADSDSSGPESVDSEPDSEDEAFIEDDGPFRPEMLSCYGPLFPPIEYTERSTTIEDDDGSEASLERHFMDLT